MVTRPQTGLANLPLLACVGLTFVFTANVLLQVQNTLNKLPSNLHTLLRNCSAHSSLESISDLVSPSASARPEWSGWASWPASGGTSSHHSKTKTHGNSFIISFCNLNFDFILGEPRVSNCSIKSLISPDHSEPSWYCTISSCSIIISRAIIHEMLSNTKVPFTAGSLQPSASDRNIILCRGVTSCFIHTVTSRHQSFTIIHLILRCWRWQIQLNYF